MVWKVNSSIVVSLAIAASLLSACSTSPQNPPPPADNTSHAGHAQPTTHEPMHHNHQAMSLGPADASYDLRFIDSMIAHHEGAIAMAEDAQKSKRPEIRQLADGIIQAQTQEIKQLQQWRQQWYPQASTTAMMYDDQKGETVTMSDKQLKAMRMDADLEGDDSEFDLRFIQAMTAHHEGAVDMAQDALQKASRSEIKQLAQGIIEAQEAEIQQMQQWRKSWYE